MHKNYHARGRGGRACNFRIQASIDWAELLKQLQHIVATLEVVDSKETWKVVEDNVGSVTT